MIEFANKRIRDFVASISNPKIQPIDLYVIPGYDTLELPDGQRAFAVYDRKKNRIIVADNGTEQALNSIAREYYLYMDNVEHDEDKAKAYADKMVEKWKQEREK